MVEGKVVGFGDLLVRLSPPNYKRFIQADHFEINYTGAEANVLVNLGYNQISCDFITRLPNHAITNCAIAKLKSFNVGVDNIALGGDRLGIYYLEKGASQRPSALIYDRKHTSLATAERTDFDWEHILDGASVFHFTGITPALGPNLPDICMDACQTAKRLGVTVTCDLNYRAKLWDLELAQATMQQLVKYVDVLIGNEEDSEKLLGVKPANTDVTQGKLSTEAYIDVATELVDRYGFKSVAFTLRQSISASDNGWKGMLYKDGQAFFSKEYLIHLVDRVGGGDSFAAGIIYAMLHQYDPQTTIDYAIAASCLKQTIEQDFNLSTAEEVRKLMDGDGSGRIVR